MQDSASDARNQHILLSVNSNQWLQEKLDLQALCTRLFAMVTRPLNDAFEVSMVFTSDEEIQKLNATYRSKDKPTNVLSFPSGLYTHDQKSKHLPVIPLGDVVLAYEFVKQEATERGISFQDHLSHLLIHGFLHLLGYDHELDNDAEIMEAQEIRYLENLGIKNPYLVRE